MERIKAPIFLEAVLAIEVSCIHILFSYRKPHQLLYADWQNVYFLISLVIVKL